MDKTIDPDPQDFDTVDARYGTLPEAASVLERATHFRRAQASKLIRLYHRGDLSPEIRRYMRLLTEKDHE
jgi:hypothetical protein